MRWQLTLAPNKCATFSIGRQSVSHTYFINNVPLQNVTNYKDLGVVIDLSFPLTAI
jgi:hypothetical protein